MKQSFPWERIRFEPGRGDVIALEAIFDQLQRIIELLEPPLPILGGG